MAGFGNPSQSTAVPDECSPLVEPKPLEQDSEQGFGFGVVLAISALTLANLATQSTRFLLNFLYMENVQGADSTVGAADPHVNIALDLGISPTHYGILTGPLLMMVAVVSSIILGGVADDARVGPRVLIICGLLVQGLSTCGQALVSDISQLYLVRILFAIGQGAVTAPALAIISLSVSSDKLATANSAFGTAIYLGSGLAAVGGILAFKVGWRVSSAIFGCICLFAAAAVTCAVPIPTSKRRSLDVGGFSKGVDYTAKFDAMRTGFQIWGRSRSSLVLTVAGCLRFFAGFSTASFLPVFLADSFGRKTEMLSWYGCITAVAGVTSSLLGGHITQRLLATTPAAAAWVAGVGSIGAAIFSMGILYLSPSLEWAMVCFLGKVLLGECWTGPALSIAQGMAPNSGGTSCLASFLAILTSVGTVGPWAVGELHERGYSLDKLLFISVTCSFAFAGLLFVGLAVSNPRGFLPLHSQSPISARDDAGGSSYSYARVKRDSDEVADSDDESR